MTVLLPVHDGGPHLAEAVESILAQTHRELELLVIDDGSTDGTGAYLDALEDPRVRVLHQPNAGLVATLDRGLREARHELVARMDADDVSDPRRLDLQVAFMAAHPEVAALGSCFQVMDEDGTPGDVVHVAAAPAYLRRQLHFRNVLPHAGMLVRRSAVLAVGGYRDVGPVEDYDLWARLAEHHDLAALPDVLLRYRVTPTGISQQAAERQQRCLDAVREGIHRRGRFPRTTAAQVVREGLQHVAAYGPTCRGTAQWYAFDHAWLAVHLARRRRLGQALRLLVGTAAFCVLRPRAVLGLPPVMTLRAALQR